MLLIQERILFISAAATVAGFFVGKSVFTVIVKAVVGLLIAKPSLAANFTVCSPVVLRGKVELAAAYAPPSIETSNVYCCPSGSTPNEAATAGLVL